MLKNKLLNEELSNFISREYWDSSGAQCLRAAGQYLHELLAQRSCSASHTQLQAQIPNV